MKQKRKFTKSLIRPIFNALIGLIMLLSFAIGIVGYFEFADALKQQHGIEVDKKKIRLEEPIKSLGIVKVTAHMYENTDAKFSVEVLAAQKD